MLDEQAWLQRIPKVFCQVEVRTLWIGLCRPVKLFHTKLAYPYIYTYASFDRKNVLRRSVFLGRDMLEEAEIALPPWVWSTGAHPSLGYPACDPAPLGQKLALKMG